MKNVMKGTEKEREKKLRRKRKGNPNYKMVITFHFLTINLMLGLNGAGDFVCICK